MKILALCRGIVVKDMKDVRAILLAYEDGHLEAFKDPSKGKLLQERKKLVKNGVVVVVFGGERYKEGITWTKKCKGEGFRVPEDKNSNMFKYIFPFKYQWDNRLNEGIILSYQDQNCSVLEYSRASEAYTSWKRLQLDASEVNDTSDDDDDDTEERASSSTAVAALERADNPMDINNLLRYDESIATGASCHWS